MGEGGKERGREGKERRKEGTKAIGSRKPSEVAGVTREVTGE